MLIFLYWTEHSFNQAVHRISLELYKNQENKHFKWEKNQSNHKHLWTFWWLTHYYMETLVNEPQDVHLNLMWQRKVYLSLELRVEITYLLFIILKSLRWKIVGAVSSTMYYFFIQKNQNLLSATIFLIMTCFTVLDMTKE